MADFYSSLIQSPNFNPIDAIYKDDAARIQNEQNRRAAEKQAQDLENEARQQERADQYLKINKVQNQRNYEKYQREVETNRSVRNLYNEYRTQNKPIDVLGSFGDDLERVFAEGGLYSSAMSLANAKAVAADKQATREAKRLEDANDAILKAMDESSNNAQGITNIKRGRGRSDPTTGFKGKDKTPVQLNPETNQWEPIPLKEKSSSSGFWSLFGMGGDSSEPAPAPLQAPAPARLNDQSKLDILQLRAQGVPEEQINEVLNYSLEDPSSIPIQIPEGDSAPVSAPAPIQAPRSGGGLYDTLASTAGGIASGMDNWFGSQLSGASRLAGDTIQAWAGENPLSRGLNSYADIAESFGRGGDKRFGVDTPAEQFVADLTGAGLGTAKSVAAGLTMGAPGLAMSLLPEMRNKATEVERAGGDIAQQRYGAVAQGGIDLLGETIANRFFGPGGTIIKKALAEGGTEFAQEVASIIGIDLPTAIKDPTLPEAAGRAGYAGLLGGIGGGVVGSVTGRSPRNSSTPGDPNATDTGGIVDAVDPNDGQPTPSDNTVGAGDKTLVVKDGIASKVASDYYESFGYEEDAGDLSNFYEPTKSTPSTPIAEEILTVNKTDAPSNTAPSLIQDAPQIAPQPLAPSLYSQEFSQGLYYPTPEENDAYQPADGPKLYERSDAPITLPSLINPSQSVVNDINHLHELSDYYEEKPLGTLNQSIISGGEILPSKIGGFDFSGNKISKGGILTPEVKIDMQVGPVVAIDPSGVELRLPPSPEGTATRAEIDKFFRGRFGGQRGAVRLPTNVASSSAGKLVVNNQKHNQQAIRAGIDRFWNTSYAPEGLNNALKKFSQATVFGTTVREDLNQMALDDSQAPANRYYATTGRDALDIVLSTQDAYHSALADLEPQASKYAQYSEKEAAVAFGALSRAQTAKNTQPNFNEQAFYQNYKVPVGPNQFRPLTPKEMQAISDHKTATDATADQLVATQIARKKHEITIEGRKIVRSLSRELDSSIGQLYFDKTQGNPLPAVLTPGQQVGLKVLDMWEQSSNNALATYTQKLNDLGTSLKNSPYAPLIRQGKYSVVMTDSKDNQLHFSLHKTTKEAQRMEATLKKAYPSRKVERKVLSEFLGQRAQYTLGSLEGAIARAEQESGFKQIVEAIAKQPGTKSYAPADLESVATSVKDSLAALGNELGVSGQGVLTNLLARDNLIRMKNPISGNIEVVPLPGYEADSRKALMTFVRKAAYFNTQTMVDASARAKIEQLPQNSQTTNFLREKLALQLGQPTATDRFVSGVQQVHVMSTLAGRVSSALNSAIGATLVTYPNISSLNSLRRKKGLRPVSPELAIGNSARLAATLSLPGGNKLVEKYAKSNDPKKARLAQALKLANKEAIFGFDASTEWEANAWADKGGLQKTAEQTMFMFTMAEHLANRTSFIAHFNALDGVHNNFADQYNGAKNWMRSVNPYNTKGNRPTFSSGYMRIPTAFKMYQGQQLRLWRTWLSLAAKGDRDGVAAVARAFGGIMTIVGANGIPFVPDAIKMAQAFGYSLRKELEDATDEMVSDIVTYGALASLVPEAPTLAGSLSAGEFLPQSGDVARNLADPSKGGLGQAFADATTGVVFGSYMRYGGFGNALTEFSKGNYEQAAQDFIGTVNAAAGSVYKAGRAVSEGQFTNRRGDAAIDRDGNIIRPNPINIASMAMGMNPKDVALSNQLDFEDRIL